METYYLIDYENVGSGGLSGCEKLNKTDHIIIFFTKNAKKIDMSEIANHGDSELDMIEVPAGKQSTDIHIGSYLGYLAGTNIGKDCRVVIISKDTDFDNVIKFWKVKTGVKASRIEQIKALTPKSTTVNQTESSKKIDGSKKVKLNQEIMKAVSAAGFDSSVANTVAQLTVGFLGADHFANDVHNALMKKYENYLEVYESVKSVLLKYDKAVKPSANVSSSSAPTSQDKTKLNVEIMQTLSKAGYNNEITTNVASIVVKNLGVKNGKQQTYRAIISKYGQTKGLEIYNQIKKKIL